MHRLLTISASLDAEQAVLSREAAKHLKVLRPEDGEEVELFDGHGRTRVYRWHAGVLSASGPLRNAAPRAFDLTLFACVTKGSRWDWTVEKATELGVSRIVPVISARTIVRLPKDDRAAKRERWMRVAEDAARQSDAVWLPEVTEAVDFADALPLVRETTCYVGALTDPPSEPILAAVRRHPPARHAALFTGPEGDFTPGELGALLEIAVPTNFGPTVLRAETAAIYGLSVLAAALNT